MPPEDGPVISEIALLFNKDIQSISFDIKHYLVVKFTLLEGGKSTGYMLDGNVLTMMKEKCASNDSEDGYIHQLFIDTYNFDFPIIN